MNASPYTAKTTLTLCLLLGAGAPAWGAGSLESVRLVGWGASAASAGNTAMATVTDAPLTPDVQKTITQAADTLANGAFLLETTAVGTTLVTGSGATIMHTLAVAGGPVVMAGATGVSAAGLMNDTLYSDCQDQSACDAARYGTYGGAVLGTAASAATVAAVGAGPVGLATIGSVVGGGMVAGVGVLVAAPVVAAAVIGGAVYWVMSD